ISNTSTMPFLPAAFSLTGDVDDFRIAGNECDLAPLAPGGGCRLVVLFQPKSGGPRKVLVKSGGLIAAISGEGLDPRIVRFEPRELDFGEVVIGSEKTATLSLINDSGEAIESGVTLPFLAGEFRVVTETCHERLTPSNSCSFVVAFAPKSRVVTTDRLGVGALRAKVRGTGVGSGFIAVSPSSFNFGDVPINTKVPATFHVTNATATPFPLSLGLTGGIDFSIVASLCPPALLPGGSCDVTVEFFARGGSAMARLSAGPGSLGANVSANVPVPKVTVSPPGHDFGNVTVNTTAVKTFTVTTDIAVTFFPGFAFPAPFVVTPNGSCAGPLAAGQSCTIEVAFTPTAVGPVKGALSVSVNPAVEVRGTGVPPSAVTLSPAAQSFGTVAVGQLGQATLTLANTTASAFAPAVSFGGADASQFYRSGGTCGTSVPAGSSCTIIVVFAPTSPGDKSATLSVGGTVNTAALTGTGQGRVTITPAAFDYGNVTVGQSASQIFTITNGFATPIFTITAFDPAGDFIFDINLGTCANRELAPGLSCTIGVHFQPSSLGPKASTLV